MIERGERKENKNATERRRSVKRKRGDRQTVVGRERKIWTKNDLTMGIKW